MSGAHFRVSVDESGECWIEDLGSKNGTLLKSKPVQPGTRVRYKFGDEIKIVESSSLCFYILKYEEKKVDEIESKKLAKPKIEEEKIQISVASKQEKVKELAVSKEQSMSKSLLEKELADLKGEVDKLSEKRRFLQEDLADLNDKVLGEVKKNKTLTDDNSKLEKSIDEHFAKFKNIEEKVLNIEHTYQQLLKERMDKLNADCRAYELDIEKYQKEVEDLKSQRKELEEFCKKFEEDRIKAEHKINQLNADINNLNEKNFNLEREKSLLESDNRNIKKLIFDSEVELDRIKLQIKTTQLEFESTHSQLLQSLKEREERLNKSVENEKTIIADLKAEIEKLKSEKNSIKSEIRDCQAELEIKKDENVKELANLKSDLEHKKEEFSYKQIELENRYKEYLKQHEEEIAKLKYQSHELDLEIRKKKEDVLKSNEELIDEARAKSKTIVDEAEHRAKQILLDAQAQSKEIEKQADVQAKNEIEKLRQKYENDFSNRLVKKSQELSIDLGDILFERLNQSKAKMIDDTIIENIRHEMVEFATSSFLDQANPQHAKIKEMIQKRDSERQKKHATSKVREHLAYALAGVLVLIFVFPQVAHKPKSLVYSLVEKNEVSDEQRKQMREVAQAKVDKLKYKPKQTPEYKDSYVDNFLFTSDYMTKKAEKSFYDNWVLELNNFFVFTLDQKDTAVIKFISMETNMLKELERLSKEIDPEMPEVKINEMRDVEDLFKKRLKNLVETDENVEKIYEKNKNLWLEKYKE